MDKPGILLKEFKKETLLIFPDKQDDVLNVLWNTGAECELTIDNDGIVIHKNCVLFIPEFYMRIEGNFESARLFRFHKTFLNPVNTLNNVGDFLMLFYGLQPLSHIRKISLRDDEFETFDAIWKDMRGEYFNIKNPISQALVRNQLQRLLLLGQKIHMQSNVDIPIDFKDLKIIREFQYLVNHHFKEFARVADYANLLKISPKKIAELFGCCFKKKASELISGRRNVFAKRQLIHTSEPIKSIAYDLNFSDSQTFSHFFKRQNGISPDQFRKQYITRLKGTERAGSGEFCHAHDAGQYNCICCDTPLFDSTIKFNSGTGWPSFTQPIKENAIKYENDVAYRMIRVEVMCNVCDAHQGHVFPDGPAPSGLRYCINSESINLVKESL